MSFTIRCLFCQGEYKTLQQLRDCPHCGEPAKGRCYLPARWLTQRRALRPQFLRCACGVVHRGGACCERCGTSAAPSTFSGRPSWVAVSLRWYCSACGRVRSRLDWRPRAITLQDLDAEDGCLDCHLFFQREDLYERLLFFLHGLVELIPSGEERQVVLPLYSILHEYERSRSSPFSFSDSDPMGEDTALRRDPPLPRDPQEPLCLLARIFLGVAPCPSCGSPAPDSMCQGCGHIFARSSLELEDAWQEHRRLREAILRPSMIYLHEEPRPSAEAPREALYRDEGRPPQEEAWYWLLLQSEEPSRMRQRLEQRAKALPTRWQRFWRLFRRS